MNRQKLNVLLETLQKARQLNKEKEIDELLAVAEIQVRQLLDLQGIRHQGRIP